ncbi:efflux transporter outer membrane subunit [Vineibacter terrae]|uniref:Efflux transporter outer membrane subunit n=1 Tax=Vineibacter terrae TaxID=2586908 RepID=A0A5C8PM46_9HYPH|nr:efflux transporter outer membrane subunit [Vineibacter terrae]TXL74828.1 efflux transporter outer membrane subunit [Vineibacter terrae]
MRRLLVSIALAGTLAGCSALGPDYQPEQVDVPEHWQWSNQGTGVWPDLAWWQVFRSPELDRLMSEAAAGNRDLKAAVARIAQAEAQAKVAGAAVYPTIGFDGSLQRSSQTSSFTGRRATVNSYSIGPTAGYQLNLFGADFATARAATTRVEASRYDRETVALTINTGVAQTYFQILTFRERVRIANNSLTTATRLLQLLEEQRRIGTTSDLEVAQQRASVATQRAAVPALIQAERESLAALALLLGRNPQGFELQARNLEGLTLPPVISGMPSELLLRRPDIRTAEANLRAANLDIQAARAARFPNISLTASGGTASALLASLFSPASMLYTVGVSLTAPIFQGGRLEGQEELTKARYEELIETYRTAILSSFRDVDTALSAIDQFRQQYAYNLQARTESREAYRLAELRYRAGTIDFLTVLDAQRTVLVAEDALAQSQLAHINAVVSLYQALGGGWSGATAQVPRIGQQ